MDWLEVLLIAVWVALAGFLGALRLAAASRRRTVSGDSPALIAWTAVRLGGRRRSPRADSAADPTKARA